MTLPRISIVIPSYNKGKYISRTLKSIVDQNYPNYEVVIQDGGSNDGSLEVIKQYARKFPQINWESKKDEGQLDAVNTGLRKVNGKIVTFINADDEYLNGSFKKVAEAYKNNPNHSFITGKGIVVDSAGREVAKLVSIYKSFLLKQNHYNLLLITNYLMQPSVFISYKAYKKYGPFTGTKEFITEYDLWLRLGKVKMPYTINSVLTKFRIEPGTKTKTGFGNLLAEDTKIVRKYTHNPLILLLHSVHNFGRILIEKFV